MINTNDLMIGNYVKVNSYLPEVIVSIEVDNVFTLPLKPSKINSRWRQEPKDLEGIPITKEWLIKLGFQKESDYEFSIEVGDNVLEFEYEGDDLGYSVYLINYHGSNYVQLKYFKYIHQLQNFYFALTGKQLTIKDK